MKLINQNKISNKVSIETALNNLYSTLEYIDGGTKGLYSNKVVSNISVVSSCDIYSFGTKSNEHSDTSQLMYIEPVIAIVNEGSLSAEQVSFPIEYDENDTPSFGRDYKATWCFRIITY